MYTNCQAAIADMSSPHWRSSAVGTYRFVRDLGYVVGALMSGILADTVGNAGAIGISGGFLLLVSGLVFRYFDLQRDKISTHPPVVIKSSSLVDNVTTTVSERRRKGGASVMDSSSSSSSSSNIPSSPFNEEDNEEEEQKVGLIEMDTLSTDHHNNTSSSGAMVGEV
jgi:MFS family permease